MGRALERYAVARWEVGAELLGSNQIPARIFEGGVADCPNATSHTHHDQTKVFWQ